MTRPCTDCDGEGVTYVPHCTGGYDHAGHNCGGRVCGCVEVECPACEGSGEVEE